MPVVGATPASPTRAASAGADGASPAAASSSVLEHFSQSRVSTLTSRSSFL